MFDFQRIARRHASRSDVAPRRHPMPVPRRAVPARVAVQRRLVVGGAGDPAEVEADRLADAALRRLASVATGATVTAHPQPTRIRRWGLDIGPEGGEVDDWSARRIEGARGRGGPLAPRVRRRLEEGFDADLSAVRVHTDADAHHLNERLGSVAFTHGRDIFFRAGQYRPASQVGERLLAHELAHTIQQTEPRLRRRAAGADATIRRALTVDATPWKEASSVVFTGEGSANGVYILTAKDGSSVVVKPAAGGARAQLASEIMKASGAHTVTGMRTVALQSPEGAQILKVLKSLVPKAKKALKKAKKEDKISGALTRLTGGAEYDSVTVMPAYANLTNLFSLASNQNFGEVFQRMLNNGFFGGLGRIHAADMISGNEDRIARDLAPSLKNTFVNTWSGEAVGLDLDLNMASFEQVTTDLVKKGTKDLRGASNAPSLKGSEHKDYVAYCIQGLAATKTYAAKGTKTGTKTGIMGMRGGAMAVPDVGAAADPAKATAVFDGLVRSFIDELARHDATAADGLRRLDWSSPKAQFLAGVKAGLVALASQRSALAARAGELQNQFGADAFLDPNVILIRTWYSALRKIYDDATTLQLLEQLAKMLAAGQTEADFTKWLKLWNATIGPYAKTGPSVGAQPTATAAATTATTSITAATTPQSRASQPRPAWQSKRGAKPREVGQ